MKHISTALLAYFAVTWLILSSPARAASDAFTMERFEALQAQNALILVDVHASWCPTCARQTEIIKEYIVQRPDVGLHWLKVDFDEQKRWVKHFRAPRQSTLLLFRGKDLLWFNVAETRAEKVFETFDAAAGATP